MISHKVATIGTHHRMALSMIPIIPIVTIAFVAFGVVVAYPWTDNHSRPVDGSNQEIPFTPIMQRSDALSPMNLPVGYNYPPASDNYSESRRPTLTQQGYQ